MEPAQARLEPNSALLHQRIVNAATTGNLSELNMVLSRPECTRPVVCMKTVQGEAAIHLAAIAGHDRCVEALLAAGADPKATAEDAWTALHWAAYHGHHKCIPPLLKHGASTEATTSAAHGACTALHYAAVEGRLECVEELLRQESSLQSPNGSEWNDAPWSGFSAKPSAPCLRGGANKFAKNKFGKMPERMQGKITADIIEMLRESPSSFEGDEPQSPSQQTLEPGAASPPAAAAAVPLMSVTELLASVQLSEFEQKLVRELVVTSVASLADPNYISDGELEGARLGER